MQYTLDRATVYSIWRSRFTSWKSYVQVAAVAINNSDYGEPIAPIYVTDRAGQDLDHCSMLYYTYGCP